MKNIKADFFRVYDLAVGGRVKKTLTTLRSAGFQTLAVYRYGRWALSKSKIVRLILDPPYFVANGLVKMVWGIELPRATKVGAGLYIGHFGGIIVSSDAEIGNNCNISQCVTIGVSGAGERRGAPVIGDNVYIGAGAKIIGKIKVGSRVRIGANAVVYKSIPDDATVVLSPGFKIIRGGFEIVPEAPSSSKSTLL